MSRLTITGLLVMLSMLAAYVPGAAAQVRPRIGLALGGGSARGLAHIGVLQWLEEHRIPVDMVAGTSMGGLVGGAYATGRSPNELVDMVNALDWNLMFLGDVPFDLKDFRRKEDRRQFPVRFELGLKGGLTIPSGLDPGHQVGLFLSRIAYPYAAPLSFDELPIPFRAVATDLEEAEVVVLEQGSLSRALRATMAIPGVFAPVELNGRFLADGGLLNNVPVDVLKALGADHVIAVDVGAALERREDLRSALQLAGQALSVMMAARTEELLAAADVVVEPEVDEFGSTDWRRATELIARGYRAADAMAAKLRPYTLAPDAWARHLQDREARRVRSASPPQYVDVQGTTGRNVEAVQTRLSSHVDEPIELDRLERDLTRLTGSGRFDSLSYEVAKDGATTGLWVDVAEKRHGPPFVNLDVELVNQTETLEFALGSRVTFYDVGARDAEARLDVTLGSDLGIGFEYFRPIGSTPLFLSGRSGYLRANRDFFEDDSIIVRYRTQTGSIGGDVGLALGTADEVRVGYDVSHVDASVQLGDPLLPAFDGRQQTARLRWEYNGQDHWMVPTKGVRAVTGVVWVIEAPDQERTLLQLTTDTSAVVPLTDHDRLFFGFVGGTSFEDQPSPFRQFTLGGRARLSAFGIDEFRGNHVLYARGGYLRQIGRLPDFAGGPAYLFGALETGSAFDKLSQAPVKHALTGGVLLETVIGPVQVSGSIAPDGHAAFYFALGRLF